MGKKLTDQELDALLREANQPGRAAAAAPGMQLPAPGEEPTGAIRARPETIAETVTESGQAQPFREAPLETAAEIGGSLVGGPIGGKVAGLVSKSWTRAALRWLAHKTGRVVGSALGAVGGSEAAVTATGEEETPGRKLQRRLTAAALGGGGEVAGQAVGGTVRTALGGMSGKGGLLGRPTLRKIAPVEERIVPGAEAAQRDITKTKGATLTAGQVVTGWPAELEKIGEAGFLARRIGKTRTHAARVAESNWRGLIREFGRGLPPDQIGTVIDEALAHTGKAHRALTRAAYHAVDSEIAASGKYVPIDLTPVLKKMESEIGTSAAAGDPKAKAMLMTMQNAVDAGPLGFKDAEAVRSQLLGYARSSGSSLQPNIRVMGGVYANEVDDLMQAAAIRSGTQAVMAKQAEARALARTGHEIFDDEVIGVLADKATPEQLTQAFFANERPTAVRALRNIIHDPRYGVTDPEGLWGEIQAAWMAGKTGAAGGTRPGRVGYGVVSGKALRESVETGGGTFEELFPDPAKRQNVLRLARNIEIAQSTPGGRGFQIYIQMTQAGQATGAAVALWMGEPVLTGGTAAILVTPSVFSRIVSNKTFVNAAIRLAKMKGTTQVQRAAAGQGLVRAMEATGEPFAVRDNESGTVTEIPPEPRGPAAGLFGGPKPISKFRINTGR